MCTVGGHCVSPLANTGSLGTSTLHLTSQSIHILHVSHTLPDPCYLSISSMAVQGSLPPIAFPRKTKVTLTPLIRVIGTGPPETKELLNCCPLAHLEDHLIKPLCVCFILSLFLIIPIRFSVIPFFQSFVYPLQFVCVRSLSGTQCATNCQ